MTLRHRVLKKCPKITQFSGQKSAIWKKLKRTKSQHFRKNRLTIYFCLSKDDFLRKNRRKTLKNSDYLSRWFSKKIIEFFEEKFPFDLKSSPRRNRGPKKSRNFSKFSEKISQKSPFSYLDDRSERSSDLGISEGNSHLPGIFEKWEFPKEIHHRNRGKSTDFSSIGFLPDPGIDENPRIKRPKIDLKIRVEFRRNSSPSGPSRFSGRFFWPPKIRRRRWFRKNFEKNFFAEKFTLEKSSRPSENPRKSRFSEKIAQRKISDFSDFSEKKISKNSKKAASSRKTKLEKIDQKSAKNRPLNSASLIKFDKKSKFEPN